MSIAFPAIAPKYPRQFSKISLSVSSGPIWSVCFFAKTFGIGFSLLRCLIDILTNLGNALVFTRWLDIDNKALLVSRANNPPIRESRIGSGGNPYGDSSTD
jgi:hypothetical protein